MPTLDPWRLAAAAAATLIYLLLCWQVWHRHRRRQRQTMMSLASTKLTRAGTGPGAEVGSLPAHPPEPGQPSPDIPPPTTMTTPPESPSAGASRPGVLMVYASQSGTAESLARQSAQRLQDQGIPIADILPLQALDAEQLKQASLAVFVVSTTGEGNAPDNAALFVDTVMAADQMPPTAGDESGWLYLPNVHYGLLALGDRSYMNFCGFGHQLDDWLQEHGARPLFDLIEVDNLDPEALDAWEATLANHARFQEMAATWSMVKPNDTSGTGHQASGSQETPPSQSDVSAKAPEPANAVASASTAHPAAASWQRWQLQSRQCLNTGSLGQPIHHLTLLPADGQPLPHWDAGDIALVLHASESNTPREYSIASIPEDGHLALLVREEKRADGSPGLVSGWLGTELKPADTLDLRIRPNPGFHQRPNQHRPLILIGNGAGMAGLRVHLRSRAQSKPAPACWLIFGERQAAHDQLYRDETDAWLANGVLARIDRVFSRDGTAKRYVQDILLQEADLLRQWVNEGAALYVCGSRQGMGNAVDETLKIVLTPEIVHQLMRDGRYCRDVY
ncbi:MAG: sulfite reductase subunit alpha [Lautropia sp.]|nr:sulfite reductase subunit alpha [Lautropia sp.]